MALWILMLMAVLLTPLIMTVCGRSFMKHAPEDIDSAFGYRSKRSLQNRETWEFAHRYIGRLWFVCGLASIPPSLAAMLAVIGKSPSAVGSTGTLIIGLQAGLVTATMIPTEIALKKRFDKSGRPR